MAVLKISGNSSLGNKLSLNRNEVSVSDLDLQLSVIRNQEMDNTVGNVGSTNLTISNIAGNVLTVPNLPDYSGFNREITSWACKNTTSNNIPSVLCSSISYEAKTVTLTSASGFSIGNTISLYNPFLNWSFSGDQSTNASIPVNPSKSWMASATGGGTLIPKKDGLFRWIFYGTSGSGFCRPGLATSSNWTTWDVSNNQNPILEAAEVPGSPTSIYFAGNYVMSDTSICTLMGTNVGMRIVSFNNDVSDFSFSDIIFSPRVLVPGGLAKIGSYYHMLYMDVSTDLAHREICAAKSLSIDGPWTEYQKIVHAAIAPTGTIWDLTCDMPVIINDGNKIFGIFGGQTNNLGGGVGYINREGVLLDFDSDTETWSINSKGPVLLNPIDWPVGSWPPWFYDHIGIAISTQIDGSTMYMGMTFKGYLATMLKLKNFTNETSSSSISNKLMLGEPSIYIPPILQDISVSAVTRGFQCTDSGWTFDSSGDILIQGLESGSTIKIDLSTYLIMNNYNTIDDITAYYTVNIKSGGINVANFSGSHFQLNGDTDYELYQSYSLTGVADTSILTWTCHIDVPEVSQDNIESETGFQINDVSIQSGPQQQINVLFSEAYAGIICM